MVKVADLNTTATKVIIMRMKIGKATGDLTGRKLLQIVYNKVEYI